MTEITNQQRIQFIQEEIQKLEERSFQYQKEIERDRPIQAQADAFFDALETDAVKAKHMCDGLDSQVLLCIAERILGEIEGFCVNKKLIQSVDIISVWRDRASFFCACLNYKELKQLNRMLVTPKEHIMCKRCIERKKEMIRELETEDLAKKINAPTQNNGVSAQLNEAAGG
ncbi:MAG: hypothetical protein IKZ87_00530 [Actinomycetaceae bacterium]|nr:hypothetical protein [Actinomycetaceae bacterium]